MFVILIVSIVPAIIGTLQTYWGSLIAMDATIGGYLEGRALQLSKLVEESLHNKREVFLELSSDRQILTLCKSILQSSEKAEARKELETQLRNFVKNRMSVGDGIVVASLKGKALASTITPIEGFGEREWWKDATAMPAGMIYMAEEHPSEQRGKALLIFAMPISPEPSQKAFPQAMLLGVLSIEHLFPEQSIIRSSEQWAVGVLSSRGSLVLASQNGFQYQPVLQSHFSHLKSEYCSWFPTQEVGHTKDIVAFCSVNPSLVALREKRSNFEWFAFVAFDVSDVAVVINLLLWRMSVFGLIMVVALLAIGLYLSNRIVYPIKTLHKGILGIASGNLDSRVRIRTGDEIEDLADGFNKMAEELKKTYGELQSIVVEVREKAGQIALIHEITQAVNSALELDKIFLILAVELKKIVDYDYAAVSLMAEEDGYFYNSIIHPPLPENEARRRLPLTGSTLERLLQTREPLLRQDLSNRHETPDDEELLKRGIHSSVSLPLLSASGVNGAFTLGHKRVNFYGEKELGLLRQITTALSVAVEHSRLYTRVRRFADELEEKVKERTRQLEEAHKSLVVAEKFAASGKLAAGMAHEINNPLGIIKNYLRLFTDELQKHQACLESLGLNMQPLGIINEELARIARIVRTLLDLYRPSAPVSVPTDVNLEITRLIELMSKNLEGKGISVLLDLEEDMPQPFLSPDQVRQVLLNIFRNAEDAMPDGGEIRARSRFLGGGPQGGKNIEVVIEDTGSGIPGEIMGNIFDPFFTTKKEGEATGLGLFVTYGILQGMGGDISIASEPGKGTTVRILFPAVFQGEK
jgi:signal transduction histidine kinase